MRALHEGMQLGSMAISLGPDLKGFQSEQNGLVLGTGAPVYVILVSAIDQCVLAVGQ